MLKSRSTKEKLYKNEKLKNGCCVKWTYYKAYRDTYI
jgi:hypothetical protein